MNAEISPKWHVVAMIPERAAETEEERSQLKVIQFKANTVFDTRVAISKCEQKAAALANAASPEQSAERLYLEHRILLLKGNNEARIKELELAVQSPIIRTLFARWWKVSRQPTTAKRTTSDSKETLAGRRNAQPNVEINPVPRRGKIRFISIVIALEVVFFFVILLVLSEKGVVPNSHILFFAYVLQPLVIALTGCISGNCSKSRKVKQMDKDFQTLKTRNAHLQEEAKCCQMFIDNCKSNLTAIPYMAGIIAEVETHGYEVLAEQLDWGYDKARLKKVASIREIKRDAKEKIEQAKQCQYQLEYLLAVYPGLEEMLDTDWNDLPPQESPVDEDRDISRDYLSREEWDSLSTAERNQLALDRYVSSHKKTKWQIGREYEEYVAYLYRKKGFTVDTYGAHEGVNDLGRDLIAKKGKSVYIVQCKCWSKQKTIHENHVNQLHGTTTAFSIEHKGEGLKVQGVIVTTTLLSDMAHKFADTLGIEVMEDLALCEFPRIKCNIGKDGQKIYHLPFDQQYDTVKIDRPGEFYAMTVAEAEQKGFRRAFRWHGDKSSPP